LKDLNLYEWEPKLQHQTQLIKKIKELTDLNNQHSEDDYEDEELISQTYKIKSLIGNIRTNDIHAIIQECEEL
jgi:esterase/lipase